jgi:hypothetical protein
MRFSSTHLRKTMTLLECIRTTHPDAKVKFGSAEIGCWKDLEPQWSLYGARIRLQLYLSGRNAMFWIESVRATPWGVRIRIADRREPRREIRVKWIEPVGSEVTDCARILAAPHSWLPSILPGCRIVYACQAPDRSHTLSGNYLRMRLRQGATDHLLLACADGCDEAVSQGILGQSLLWLSWLTERSLVKTVPTIHLLVPEGHAAVVGHRSALVNPERARVKVWEFAFRGQELWEVRPPDPSAAPAEDCDFRWPVLGPFRWSRLLSRVMDLAPFSIQRYPRFHDYDSLRILGLEFARALGPDRDCISYGIGPRQTELTEDNFPGLRLLVEEILYFRRADSPSTDHPYYRMQAERWLECLLLNEAAFLFPELAPGKVYPQIPVYLGKIPGRVDILGIDLLGSLTVMELKVTEDPDLPLQALDYWGRVIGHNLNGDFERRGYFPGVRLSRTRPRIYLISPVFTFHDSLERVLRCLSADLEVTKIAINEDWRCGPKIMRRTEFKCGDL